LKILVTGGLGFIGSYIVDELVNRGYEVNVLDNLSSGFWENKNTSSLVTYFIGDVRSKSDVEWAAEDAEIIFHLAEYIPNQIGHVMKSSLKDPMADLLVSTGGTLNVLEVAKNLNAHVIFTSTVSVYGDYEQQISEDFPTRPISAYGVAKLAAEEYCRYYNRVFHIPVTIFRCFTIYGDRQKKYIMYDVIQKLLADPNHLELIGDGQEKRDYTYITDAIAQMFYHLSSQTDSYALHNIGTGKVTSTDEVVAMICEEMGLNPAITHTGKWTGNAQTIVSNNKVVAIPVKEGIKRLVTKLKVRRSPY